MEDKEQSLRILWYNYKRSSIPVFEDPNAWLKSIWGNNGWKIPKFIERHNLQIEKSKPTSNILDPKKSTYPNQIYEN